MHFAFHFRLLSLSCVALIGPAWADAPQMSDTEAAYTRTISERADKIVATLDIANASAKARVQSAIAKHYRDLRGVSDASDAQIKALKAQPIVDKIAIQTAQSEAKIAVEARHKEFIGQLLADLSPVQVDSVKDGLTYGVVPLTYGVYLQMLPNLTDAQKAQIRAWLYEAREYAIDGGSSGEKHGWFGKYKGRINNYLSKAGIDMKQAEKEMSERQKAAPRTP